MRSAIFIGDADSTMRNALSVTVRNKLIRMAPPVYKNVIMALLIQETGNPLDEVIEKMQQLSNLVKWGPWGSAGNQDT